MLFNSLEFLIFLIATFILYWFVTNQNLKSQNLLVVFVSYIFYGWWDWRFLGLILISTIVDYLVGIQLSKQEAIRIRKVLLGISIIVNIGILGFFKYFNFFIDNFITAFSFLGFQLKAPSLNIILPVGISFYTFQTLSYSIDVYRKKIKSSNDFIAFAAFVCFFPQLVAGPIERAANLLPQFHKKRAFQYNIASDGCKQILWGFFKKIVIADNCAVYVNLIFGEPLKYSGSTLVLGALLFSFQIYGDFSGYSDIAIGVSKLFGIKLNRNFAFPYFSRDIAEFWRRWHISLTSWFRDYIYIPLGGSQCKSWKKIRNTILIFIISGFWHGANWTFIIWGAINALYFMPLLLMNKNHTSVSIVAKNHIIPGIKEIVGILITFCLTTFSWIFFRAESLENAIIYITGIFNKSIFTKPEFISKKEALPTIILLIFFIIVEWIGRKNVHTLSKLFRKEKRLLQYVFYVGIISLIGLFMVVNGSEFIYFQF
ncbi:MAG: MBOAT family protein [Spirochaetales bacterium]|nr:MBOAT family protein [Spirochaetales bacterium]